MQTKRRHWERGGACLACRRPLPAQDPTREGRGTGGRLTLSVRQHPLPLLLPLTAGRVGLRCALGCARSDVRAQRCPHLQLLPGRGNRGDPGFNAGARGPSSGPSPLPTLNRGLWARAPAGERAAEYGSWLPRTPRLPGGTGGGPRRGNPIPQHRPRSKPAPNFPSGVEELGAALGPGEDPGPRPENPRDPSS